MLAKTHVAFGFLIGLLFMPFINNSDIILFFAVLIIGSLLPDIDSPNSKISSKIPIISFFVSVLSKHRGIFHSIFPAIIFSLALGYFSGFSYGTALFLGYISHLVIDGLTKEGINFLHPLGRIHLSGFVETGKISEWIVFYVLIGIIFIKLAYF